MKKEAFTITGYENDRDEFTLTKGDRVAIRDCMDYFIGTVIGFGKCSVKVRFQEPYGLYNTRKRTESFDKHGWQYGTRGNYGYFLYTIEEGFKRIDKERHEYFDRCRLLTLSANHPSDCTPA